MMSVTTSKMLSSCPPANCDMYATPIPRPVHILPPVPAHRNSQLIAKYHHRVDSRNYFTSQEITYRRGRQPKISGDLVGCCSSLLTQLFKSTSYFHTFFFGVIHIHLPPLSYIQVSIMYMAGIDRILQTFLRKLSRELIALVTSTAMLKLSS